MRNKGLLTKMLSGVIASAMAVSLLSAGTFAQGKVSVTTTSRMRRFG